MKKVVPTLRQEVKVKVDIVTSDDIKIYYTGKFQDFTARYIRNGNKQPDWLTQRYLKPLLAFCLNIVYIVHNVFLGQYV